MVGWRGEGKGKGMSLVVSEWGFFLCFGWIIGRLLNIKGERGTSVGRGERGFVKEGEANGFRGQN